MDLHLAARQAVVDYHNVNKDINDPELVIEDVLTIWAHKDKGLWTMTMIARGVSDPIYEATFNVLYPEMTIYKYVRSDQILVQFKTE